MVDLVDDHVDELQELLAAATRQREVLVLHYVADLDVASIAKLLIGVGTVAAAERGRQAIVRTVDHNGLARR